MAKKKKPTHVAPKYPWTICTVSSMTALLSLRWYGTPCNIYKMKEFYIMITTKVFKCSKSIIFALKFHKRDKKNKQTGARFKLIIRDWYRNLSSIVHIKPINENNFLCLFQKEIRHIMEVSHSPLIINDNYFKRNKRWGHTFHDHAQCISQDTNCGYDH